MPRLCLILLLCLATGATSAQVFPRIEKADVKKRIATGGEQPDDVDPKDDDPKDTAVAVDGPTVLRRYRELLKGYNDSDEKKAMTKHVNELHVSVRDYLEGVFLLRLGYYKEAERKLKDVGHTVRKENELSTPELLNLANDIKSGMAYYYRMMAVALQHFDDFKNEKEAQDAWADAAKEAGKVRRELDKLVSSNSITGSEDVPPKMTAWLLTTKREWLNLFKAEQNIEASPENVLSWQFLVSNTGSKQNDMKQEYTPNYLKQRAALTVIKEFWPKALYVTGGWADVTLAINHLGSGQLDNWRDYLEEKDYHGPGGRTTLKKARDGTEEYVKVIEALKNK
ncbi:MAG: hypothetical protein H6839_07830 [Planctomycetes bacterium]|nr:hypothetical protein [Planctomycetota bacterium]